MKIHIQKNTLSVIFTTLIIMSVLAACNTGNQKADDNSSAQIPNEIPATTSNDTLLFELTDQLLLAMEAKDYKKVSSFFHPVHGVRFSPYANIDTLANITLTKESFIEHLKKQTKMSWGSFNGSGEDIFMTVEQYFNRFVYNANYLKESQKSLNKIIGKGNTLNNIGIIYKDCDFIECYIPGFDKNLDGMDWCSLRLVYKKYQGQYFLAGLVHDQWTI